MSLTFHWFLPTSGDGRSIIGRGHSIPMAGGALPTSAAVTSQASSHQVPVGVSTPVKPDCSAALATWPR